VLPTSIAVPVSLETLLGDWKKLLADWSASGALSRSAREALLLKAEPEALTSLLNQWRQGDFSALPPVVLLPASSMPGAAGAYALSTGSIYLNQDWLAGASADQAIAVLTEELGHHLDAVLNAADSPGDEGELFARLLLGERPSAAELLSLRMQADQTSLLVNGRSIAAEAADVVPKVFATPIRFSGPTRTSGEWKNAYAMAALKADGSVVAWGNPQFGGDKTKVSDLLKSGVSQIFSNFGAFAALKADGSVVPWGNNDYGATPTKDQADLLKSGVNQIFSTFNAFAALKVDGSVVPWGNSDAGGFLTPDQRELLKSGVTQIFSTQSAFAALKTDGSVVPWGDPKFGGDPGAQRTLLQSGVVQIFSTAYAFAALKSDGSVVPWGNPDYGGKLKVSLSDVSKIVATDTAFAALKTNGAVEAWGLGGDTKGDPRLFSGVTEIFSNNYAFAALKDDGSVVPWGFTGGGGLPNAAQAARLKSGVIQIVATDSAFAALKSDGSVVAWGDPATGGRPSPLQENQLQSGVTKIFSNNNAFAALKSDGSVVPFGDPNNGGSVTALQESQLKSGVIQIFSNRGSAFAALKADGSVIPWGNPDNGGKPDNAVRDNLSSGVVGFANPLTNDWLIPRRDVYRFYNSRSGVHFYTPDSAERDNVISKSYVAGTTFNSLQAKPGSGDLLTGGWGYTYEGVAYQALESQGTALHRFYNADKGYHFLSTSADEANNVIKNSLGAGNDLSNAYGKDPITGGWGYRYEGTTYKVSTVADPLRGITQAVYRFYNVNKGVHFYTASNAERDNVILQSNGASFVGRLDVVSNAPLLNGGWGYKYEGIGWYI